MSPSLASFVLLIVPPVTVLAVVYGRYLRSISKRTQDALAQATQVQETQCRLELVERTKFLQSHVCCDQMLEPNRELKANCSVIKPSHVLINPHRL